MAYTYILYSISYKRYYIGACREIEERIHRHNQGRVPYTRKQMPWELVWFTKKDSIEDAMELERKLKNLKSQKRIKEFINKYSD